MNLNKTSKTILSIILCISLVCVSIYSFFNWPSEEQRLLHKAYTISEKMNNNAKPSTLEDFINTFRQPVCLADEFYRIEQKLLAKNYLKKTTVDLAPYQLNSKQFLTIWHTLWDEKNKEEEKLMIFSNGHPTYICLIGPPELVDLKYKLLQELIKKTIN